MKLINIFNGGKLTFTKLWHDSELLWKKYFFFNFLKSSRDLSLKNIKCNKARMSFSCKCFLLRCLELNLQHTTFVLKMFVCIFNLP